MKIGVIGTGRMGSGLGRRWARAGHEVRFGSREIDKAQELAASIGFGAGAGLYADAAAFADVLLIATPWQVTRQVLESLGPLNGKIVIECTNNFQGDYGEGSTSEQVASWIPDAKVVKAFNTVFSQILHTDPETQTERGTVLMAGDDTSAKMTVATLIRDAGFDAVDAGPLANAHFLDSLAQFIVMMGHSRNLGTNIAYKLVRI